MASDWTEAHLTQICEAIASGAKRLKFADKEVEYVGTTELLRIRDVIRKALGKSKSKTVAVAAFQKGSR